MVVGSQHLVDLQAAVRVLGGVVVICAAAFVTDARGQTPAETTPKTLFECGSDGSARRVCEANTLSGVVLVHQAGEGNCALGRTWGYDAMGVWVSNGCRGTFATADDRKTLTCASTGSRQVCDAATTQGVALTTPSPACVLGKTWGYDERGIWVDGGCSGTFTLATRASVTCESGAGGRQHCAADTSGGTVLARSTSTAACALGDTWGYDATGVWVDRGCGAEFMLGQSAPGGAENRDLNDFFGLFQPYGRLRGHVAFFKDEAEVQDAASWLGLKFSTRGPVKFFAATEWGVNLVDGGQNLVAGATTNSDFFTVETTESRNVFGPRLGYAGIDFGRGGRVAVGKQWSVQFDVTSYTTDRFNVFGSQASATYTASSDGGFLGTGRPNQALSYHNKLWIVDLGAQAQFRTVDNGEFFDSAGFSAQVTVAPGLRVGGTYSKALLGDDAKRSVRGLDDDAEYGAVGARFDSRVVEIGLVYAKQRNADIATVLVPGIDAPVSAPVSIAFDADGWEGFARVRLPWLAVVGGFNDYRPDVVDPLLNPDYRVRYGIAGLEIGLGSNTYAYLEARVFDDSVGPQGEDGFDALTMGVHYGFSFSGWHRR